MPDERDTIWPAQAHTLAKHSILRRYLVAWLPIMLRRYAHIVYVDGFAGPGIYTGGEPGSPIIALQIAAEHSPLRKQPPKGKIDLVFIEERPDRFVRLEAEIAATLERMPLPAWAGQVPYQGTFEAIVLQILGRIGRETPPPPRFVFADPFGFSDVPMGVVEQLMDAPSSEFWIFFDYADMHRFLGDPSKAGTFDRLYLSSDWRQFIHESDAKKQREGLLALYGRQLKEQAEFRYVWPFELVDSLNRHYFLIFGTRNKDGFRQMKAAYWEVDPERGQFFVDPKIPGQVALLPATSSLENLPSMLHDRFKGHWVSIEDVQEFVLAETDFSDVIHLKRRTLLRMERAKPPQIKVIGRERDRAGEYPDGTMILFL